MGLYDDLQAEADGKPKSVVRVPNASTPIAQNAMDRVRGFLTGVKDVTLPFALNAAQPLTAGYRDKIGSMVTGQPEEKVTEQVNNYLGEHSNKPLNAAGHITGGVVGDVGTGLLGRAALPSVFARPGIGGGGISGGAV